MSRIEKIIRELKIFFCEQENWISHGYSSFRKVERDFRKVEREFRKVEREFRKVEREIRRVEREFRKVKREFTKASARSEKWARV